MDQHTIRLFECDPDLANKFMAFHRKNPNVYENFKKYSLELKATGATRSSHWLIVNRVRWDGLVAKTTGSRYKVSNDFIALYARLLVMECPEFEGFFKFKQMKAKRTSDAGM